MYLFDYAKALKEHEDYKKSLKDLEESRKEKESKKRDVYDFVDEYPSYPGGVSALYEWIQKNHKKPEGDKIGLCIVNFIVEKDGSFSEIKVVRSSGDEKLDEEVIRLMKTMPRWIPGKLNGERVRCRFTLPISFK